MSKTKTPPMHRGPLTAVLVGELVQQARQKQHWTQDDLASRSGTNRATISSLERGEAPDIGLSRIGRILAAVGLQLTITPKWRPTLDDLETGKENDFNEEQSRAPRPRG